MMFHPQKNRIILLFFIILSGYTVLFYNLYTIQIKQSSFFTAKGQQQYGVPVTMYPPRALIYDRNNMPLALNKDTLSAFIIPAKLIEPEKIVPFLKMHFPAAMPRLENNPTAHFMFIKRSLSENEIELIKKNQLADIHFLKEPARFYPLESTGPLVGITGADNEGLMGIELFCNELLAGTPTTMLLEKDARSNCFYFKRHMHQKGIDGNPVVLTLESNLQFLAYEEVKKTMQELQSEAGAALIMNPLNGHILAMVSLPDFDPNAPIDDMEKTKNITIADTYEFGSVIKTFLALAALAEKVTDLDEIIDCKNVKTTFINGTRVNNPVAHGQITFSEVIELSNNIGTAQIALRLGPKLYEHYMSCSFGQKTLITLPGEQKGFVNPPALWSKPSPISLSFGYEIRATLLQLCCAFCMIANHGYPIVPVLILKPDQAIKQPTERLYDQETMDKLLSILEKTVTQGGAHRTHIAGYTIRAKTGTANLLDENGNYDPDQNIFTCAAFVEKGNYKRVVVVFIKKANKKHVFASTITVPLAERIIEQMLIHENIIN
ncbi:MAG: penicillin-binding protein 2 [Candidatus Babeliaceae bacterium]